MYVALAAVVVSAVGLSRSLCLCSRENSFSDLNTVSDTQDIEDSDGSSSRTSSIFRISSYLPESRVDMSVEETPNIPTSELSALKDLYYATNGVEWHWQEGAGAKWNFTGDPNPCSDHWQGVTCLHLGPTNPNSHVVQLNLRRYYLVGSIPRSIGNLSMLTDLSLSYNKLSGQIPNTFELMQQLSLLFLDNNALSGTIPRSLISLPALTRLLLDNNALTGSIPDTLEPASQLVYLNLYDNELTGCVPTSAASLSQLSELVLGQNHLTGTIPSNFATSLSLFTLDLSGNCLTGSVSAMFGQNTSWSEVNFAQNFLTGTISPSIGSVAYLFLQDNILSGKIPNDLVTTYSVELSLSSNKLTGTVPASLGLAPNLTNVLLYSNLLTGTIPSTLGSSKKLIYLSIYRNSLSGTIPLSLGKGNFLELGLDDNALTGTIPISLGNITTLNMLNLYYNALSGTIPSTFGDLIALTSLDCFGNGLTGTIPSSLEQLEDLVELYLSNNILTGTIPNGLSKLAKLSYLSMFNNSLEGSLQKLFNSSMQSNLVQVDLHSNQLTGPLPVELFRTPSLAVAALASNCFSGTLPADICGLIKLEDLILDGLHSASSCRNRIWAISNSYTVSNGIFGTIPSCVFSLPKLRSLHLSGNELSGSLPHNVTLAPSLTELSVSHNKIAGVIPEVFQSHIWISFDVSYNLLSGTLLSSFGQSMPQKSAVYVQNNRLSGVIPSYLVNLQDVSALGSNMFSCNEDKSNLPQHDSSIDNYQCGSDAFNGPWYFVLVAAAVTLSILAVMVWFPDIIPGGRVVLSYWEKYKVTRSSLPSSCQQVYSMIEILCQVSLYSTMFIVVVLVPWYATAHHFWSTYTHTYAWVVSAAFLSGLTPGVVSIILYASLFLSVTFVMVRISKISVSTCGLFATVQRFSDNENSRPALLRIARLYLLMLGINCIAVVGVNVAFVTATLKVSNGVLTLIQILLSLFKYLWNSYYVEQMENIFFHMTGHRDVSIGFFAVQTCVGIFNNIIVPCLVVALLSPSCFYSVIDTPPDVGTLYRERNCAISSRTYYCTEEVVLVSYQPQYSYDYQCSSSFITYYAPTFVYLAITAAFVTPIANILLLYSVENANPLLRKLLFYMLPNLLNPDSYVLRCMRLGINNLLLAEFMYLSILLTFGVIFPPLGVAMWISILSVAWQLKISVGHLLRKSKESCNEHYQIAIDNIQEDCRGVASIDKISTGMVLIVGCAFCFYAVFVFDTVGDAEGFGGAYWVLIVMPLVTVFVVLTVIARKCCAGSTTPSTLVVGMKKEHPPEIELSHRAGGCKGIADTDTCVDKLEKGATMARSVLTAQDENEVKDELITFSAIHATP